MHRPPTFDKPWHEETPSYAAASSSLADTLDWLHKCPTSRENSLAITNLEQAIHWHEAAESIHKKWREPETCYVRVGIGEMNAMQRDDMSVQTTVTIRDGQIYSTSGFQIVVPEEIRSPSLRVYQHNRSFGSRALPQPLDAGAVFHVAANTVIAPCMITMPESAEG